MTATVGTERTAEQRSHLARLTRTWAPLADIAFADLLLCVPDDPTAAVTSYEVIGHVRPTTSRSLYRTEMVGVRFAADERPLLDLARTTGQVIDGGLVQQDAAPRIRTLSVPVQHQGQIIAVLSRDFSPDEQRTPGELEITYFFLFRRLAQMIADGSFPYATDEPEIDDAPRVSDGLLVLDASARVRFASPNSVSVLSRLGVRSVEGRRLALAGVRQRAVERAFATREPHFEEVEVNSHAAVVQCLPIIETGELTGAIVFVRDVTDLRRRDRLLISKDATIAEIHHRVKNNLQTISSLLRLQGRRVVADEARTAIDESVRRIRAIAVVHELLSQQPEDAVEFEDVARPLVRLVEEGLTGNDQPVRFVIEGKAGRLPAAVATPLAVVLAELMQNAVEHGFPNGATDAEVALDFRTDGDELIVTLHDNGVGVAEDFDVGAQTGLGLTIVRNLVENDLMGELTIRRDERGGTTAVVRIAGLEEWRVAEAELAAAVGRDRPF